MAEDQKSKDISPMYADQWVQAWMEEHLPELKQSVSGQQLLYRSLALSFIVGLVAQIVGYFFLLSATSGIPGLLADLLHALGWSLWTGVVVVVFIQIMPEAKRRQIKRTIEAYEAVQGEKSQAGGNRD